MIGDKIIYRKCLHTNYLMYNKCQNNNNKNITITKQKIKDYKNYIICTQKLKTINHL